MKNPLPSLNAIRCFASAARQLSFTQAAAELNVTQGAVSKQIKLLEEQLGCQLFVRKGPQLQLTSQGEELLETVSSALDIIRQGVASLRRTTTASITVSLLPSFASLWLLPRLADFERQYPDTGIRMASSFVVTDFQVSTDIDVAIRFGKGAWDDLYCQQITQDRMFPVCSPALAATINSIEDLGHQRLYFDHDNYDEWENWFAAIGRPLVAGDRRLYDDTGTQIRSAINGTGVSLLREEFVQEYLDSGLLVRLFDIDFISDKHYFLVCPHQRLEDKNIARFSNWLAQQAQNWLDSQATRQLPPARNAT